LAKADQTLTKADQTAATAERAAREAQVLLRQANPALIPTLRNLREITEAGAQLVRFFSGLGLLEPSTSGARSPSPQKKSAEGRADAMDPYKAHPTAPDPSPYSP
jgi:ABC-type transporter Mla subunit MlaD